MVSANFIHRSDFDKYFPGEHPECSPSDSGLYISNEILGYKDFHPMPDFGVPSVKIDSLFVELRDGRKLPPSHSIPLDKLIGMAKETEK